MTELENHRDFTRVHVRIDGEARAEGRLVQGNVEDVSLKGVFLKCGDTFPASTECRIELDLMTGEEPVHIDAVGRVMRADSEGMAIEFTQTDPESLVHLRNLVHFNAPDAEQVDEEIDTSLGIKRRKDA